MFRNKRFYFGLFLILSVLLIGLFILTQPMSKHHIMSVTEDSIARSQEKVSQRALQASTQALETAWHQQPNNVQFATQLAEHYVKQAKQINRDLYLYLAKQTLENWWDQEQPPLAVLSLRAYLYQAEHQFSQAKADWQQLIQRQANNLTARFSLALLQQIQGDYKTAIKSCQSLLKLQQLTLSTLCQSSVQSVNGHAERSYKLLKVLLKGMRSDDIWRQWTLVTMAEIATRLGDMNNAESHFKQVINVASEDTYIKVRYADFLLQQQRPNDLLEQFSIPYDDQALLLRQAHAARLVNNQAQIEKYQSHLSQRLNLPRQDLRQDKPSLQAAILAYYYLNIDQQPEQALYYANLNWETQKASEDLRLLLRAALLINDKKTLKIIQQWRDKTGLEDIILEDLLSKYTQ
jgi:thioredoxin-like negative regulator of GroEL